MNAKGEFRLLRWIAAGVFVLCAWGVATPTRAAGYAYVNAAVYLRAGPRIGFPILTTLYPGSGVYVYGCLSDYAWCDVTFSGERGWVDAAYLDYPYNNGFAPIIDYGPYLGLAIFSFNIGGYWRDHYFHRPWYHNRDRFRTRFGPNARRGLPMRQRYFQQRRNWQPRPQQRNFRRRPESNRRFRIPGRRNQAVRSQRRMQQRHRNDNRQQDKKRSMQQN